jgi:hypothetical protein
MTSDGNNDRRFNENHKRRISTTFQSAESLAYLPRCDLGIILVDASSTLIPEDIAIANALYQAGADVMVLLSKADMLSHEDHERTMEYARKQLQSNIGIEVPVYLVSVREAAAQLCDRWFEGVLLPKLREHQTLAAASFQRKAGVLHENVLAALKKRLARDSHRPTNPNNSPEEKDRVLSVALTRLDAARRESVEAIERPAALSDDLIQQIANDIAACWKENPDAGCDASQVATAVAGRVVGTIAEGIARSLMDIRSLLANALKQAGATAESDQTQADDLPAPSGMPALDISEITSSLQLHRPALGFLGINVLSHGISKQLETSIGPNLRNVIQRYGKQLNDWRSRFLGELGRTFTAAADLYWAWPDQERIPRPDGSGNGSPNLQNEIEKLERYAAPPPPQSALRESRM